jgi:hypothetical protein
MTRSGGLTYFIDGSNYAVRVVIPDSLTGIPPARGQTMISIYPNPFCERIVVEATNLKGSTITVISMDGRILETFRPDSSRETLDLSRLPQGIYLLNIRSASILVCSKIARR